MIVGVLSDSHGQAARTGAAVALLRRLGAEALIHCGDIGGTDVLEQLVGLPAWFVWGNMDAAPRPDQLAARLGLHPPGRLPLRIDLAGCGVLVCHGHEAAFEDVLDAARAASAGAAVPELLRGVRYALYGHTHTAAVQRIGPVAFVNPGALQRARAYSVATIDTADDVVEHWVVDDSSRADARPRKFAL